MCYYAVLVYGACWCKTMYLVHCEKGDPPDFPCEGDDKHLIARYVYGSQCEPCMTKLWRESDEEQEDRYKDQLEELDVKCLPADQVHRARAEARENFQRRLQQTEQHVTRRLEAVDDANEWLREHAKATYACDTGKLEDLMRLKPSKMTVIPNEQLFSRSSTQDCSLRHGEPESYRDLSADHAPGPSRMTAMLPPPRPGDKSTATDGNRAAPDDLGRGNDSEETAYSRKGKEKEVVPQSGQLPPVLEPSVDQ